MKALTLEEVPVVQPTIKPSERSITTPARTEWLILHQETGLYWNRGKWGTREDATRLPGSQLYFRIPTGAVWEEATES